MKPDSPPSRTARFGPFEADLHTCELRRSGKPIELQELPFRVLAALLERPGHLLSREELRTSTWSSGLFVDFEHGLNKAINKIRKALGDSAERPRFVETLPRRGYRFIAPVELLEGAAAPNRSAPRRPACRVLWDGRTIPLPVGENLIGRDPGAAVWVDSTTVSRRHAKIVVSDEGATLEDLGSKNGTFLGEQRVAAPRPLADGDEILVGSARLTFRSSAKDTSTRTALP